MSSNISVLDQNILTGSFPIFVICMLEDFSQLLGVHDRGGENSTVYRD